MHGSARLHCTALLCCFMLFGNGLNKAFAQETLPQIDNSFRILKSFEGFSTGANRKSPVIRFAPGDVVNVTKIQVANQFKYVVTLVQSDGANKKFVGRSFCVSAPFMENRPPFLNTVKIMEQEILEAMEQAQQSKALEGAQTECKPPPERDPALEHAEAGETVPDKGTNQPDEHISYENSETSNTHQTGKKHHALSGAHKVMATLYQSCDALQTILSPSTSARQVLPREGKKRRRLMTDKVKDAYIRQHVVLNALKGKKNYPKPGCENVLKQPPIYAYGSKPVLDGNTLNLHANRAKVGSPANGVSSNSNPVSALDCAGFIAASFAAAGLRFEADPSGTKPFEAELGTIWIADRPRHASSCLEHVTFPSSTLQSGDVINVADDHVIMVDAVRKDPLGADSQVQKILAWRKNKKGTRPDCRDLTANNFNFDYIHSGAVGDMGVIRVNARFHSRDKGIMFNNLVQLAVKTCHEKLNEIQGQNVKPYIAGNAPKFSILRHLGNKKEGCFDPNHKAKLKNEECVHDCVD